MTQSEETKKALEPDIIDIALETFWSKTRENTDDRLLADEAITLRNQERAALSQSPQGDAARKADAQTWQPIETAPKDGTRVLLFMNCGKQCVARTEHHLFEGPKWVIYGEMGKPNCWYLAEEDNDTTPTHWMHLPPAPASDDGVK